MRRPDFGRCHSAISAVVLLSVLTTLGRNVDAKRDKRPPWMGFAQRSADKIWKWGTVMGLYGTVGAWEREVKNPRLKRLYSSRWLLQATMRRDYKLLQHNATHPPYVVHDAADEEGESRTGFGSGQELTLDFVKKEFYKQYHPDRRDREQEDMYQRLIDMVVEYRNATFDKIKNERLNQSQTFQERFNKYVQDPSTFNLTGLKDMFRQAWFMMPQEPQYKLVKGKMWRVEPKSRDPGNPGYNPQRKEFKKKDKKENIHQGQIWRIQKQKKERIKQKILDARRATVKANRLARAKLVQWLNEPEEISLDEELICLRNADKFQDFESYRKVLHERIKKEKKAKKMRLKKLQKEAKKLITVAPSTTKRTYRRYTRRSKNPYTGTRIIGKKERRMLRKERRRVRNRTKRMLKRLRLMTTKAPKKKTKEQLKVEAMDKLAANLSQANVEFFKQIEEDKHRAAEEELRKRYHLDFKVNLTEAELARPNKTDGDRGGPRRVSPDAEGQSTLNLSPIKLEVLRSLGLGPGGLAAPTLAARVFTVNSTATITTGTTTSGTIAMEVATASSTTMQGAMASETSITGAETSSEVITTATTTQAEAITSETTMPEAPALTTHMEAITMETTLPEVITTATTTQEAASEAIASGTTMPEAALETAQMEAITTETPITEAITSATTTTTTTEAMTTTRPKRQKRKKRLKRTKMTTVATTTDFLWMPPELENINFTLPFAN